MFFKSDYLYMKQWVLFCLPLSWSHFIALFHVSEARLHHVWFKVETNTNTSTLPFWTLIICLFSFELFKFETHVIICHYYLVKYCATSLSFKLGFTWWHILLRCYCCSAEGAIAPLQILQKPCKQLRHSFLSSLFTFPLHSLDDTHVTFTLQSLLVE